MTRRPRKPVEQRLVTRAEAAEALGVSLSAFERYVQPRVRVVMVGRRVMVPQAELDRWIEENGRKPLA